MLVTFEGADGSGKTTQIELLKKRLLKVGITPVCVREPGGTKEGDAIRALLFHQNDLHFMPVSELLLFYASRAELWKQRIQPALLSESLVVCDRFIDSTYVYQGLGKEISFELLHHLHQNVMGGILPFRTYFLDVSPEVALGRRIARLSKNKYDEADADFHERIIFGYQRFYKDQQGGRVLRLNADLSPETLCDIIFSDLCSRLSHMAQPFHKES